MVTNNYSKRIINFCFTSIKLFQSKQKCTIGDMLALSSRALVYKLDSLYNQTDKLENELK
jgi:hypothetical protein